MATFCHAYDELVHTAEEGRDHEQSTFPFAGACLVGRLRAVRFIYRIYGAHRIRATNSGTADAAVWGCSTGPANPGHERRCPPATPSGFSSI